eukprot:6190384-Pleurochrysis_carterae.AAC.2
MTSLVNRLLASRLRGLPQDQSRTSESTPRAALFARRLVRPAPQIRELELKQPAGESGRVTYRYVYSNLLVVVFGLSAFVGTSMPVGQASRTSPLTSLSTAGCMNVSKQARGKGRSGSSTPSASVYVGGFRARARNLALRGSKGQQSGAGEVALGTGAGSGRTHVGQGLPPAERALPLFLALLWLVSTLEHAIAGGGVK